MNQSTPHSTPLESFQNFVTISPQSPRRLQDRVTDISRPDLLKLIDNAIFVLRAVILMTGDSESGLSELTRIRLKVAADSLQDTADLFRAKRLN